MGSFKSSTFLVALILFASNSFSDDGAIKIAAQSVRWQRLLHFDAQKKRSDIVNQNFFYATDGAISPEHELLESVQQFLLDKEGLADELKFSCRFPARKRFIESALGLKSLATCPTYERWKARAKPDSIQFVHAAQYVGNPASAFGHSFLRFDRLFRSGLLGTSLTYSAKVEPNDNSLIYALKGLFGGYEGVYEFGEYYPKVHGYANIENRELWEFELNFTTEQRNWVFDHSWELVNSGQAKYFFLDRNCTYQLLRLLDVADESLNLIKEAERFYLTPPESVKILASAGLIGGKVFRPSFRQKTLAKYLNLNNEQKDSVREVLRGGVAPESISDPDISNAIVATLAMNEIENPANEKVSEFYARAAAVRARLPASLSANLSFKKTSEQLDPLKTHGTAQIRAGFVSQNQMSAIQLGFRPAIHSLLDAPEGFLAYSQLILLQSILQIDSERSVRLREFTLIDVKSLQERSFVQSGFSWSTLVGFKPVTGSNCENCEQLRSQILIGYSSEIASKILVFGLSGVTADVLQPDTRLAARIGPSLNLGVLFRPNDQFVTLIENHFEHFVAGPFGAESLFSSEASLTKKINREQSITLKAQHTQNFMYNEKTFNEVGIHFAESF